jgi:hypothetical protein
LYTDTGEAKPGNRRPLQRLKNMCENRSGIRAVYLQVLDLMETPRDNSHPFKRFVERVRTHLFNLSTIGERVHIIELIALKLQLTDRLARNDGPIETDNRGVEIEHRKINEFD